MFDAKCLETMYIELLKCYNIQITSHVTRFADKLLTQMKHLEKRAIGRKVSLFFKDTFDSILFDRVVEPDNFMKSMRDIVQPIRNVMSLTKNTFNGEFTSDSQINSVPIQLLSLISMLIDGTNISNKGFSQASLTASQIVVYNFRKCGKQTESKRRHLKERETPVVIYNSLKIYSTVRSRILIGICLSYQRVQDITKNLYNSMRRQLYEDNVLVPQVLKKGIFSVIAKDNIDKNTRSTMITSHYHGTSLSVFQYPTKDNPGIVRDHSFIDHYSKKLDGLPKEYIDVGPLPRSHMGSDLYAPLCTMNLPSYFEFLPDLKMTMELELEWLESVSNSLNFGKSDLWSKHHASLKTRDCGIPGINAIMSMINKPVHTLETRYHVMSINRKITNFLNTSQTPLDVCDQPVYSLTKTIQWRFPTELGMESNFSLLGGLHIEQSILVIHGKLIDGSGLREILNTNELSIIGTSVAVDVNDIKRARYCLQVVVCVVYRKLKEAHTNSNSTLPLMQWLENRILESQMCY